MRRPRKTCEAISSPCAMCVTMLNNCCNFGTCIFRKFHLVAVFVLHSPLYHFIGADARVYVICGRKSTVTGNLIIFFFSSINSKWMHSWLHVIFCMSAEIEFRKENNKKTPFAWRDLCMGNIKFPISYVHSISKFAARKHTIHRVSLSFIEMHGNEIFSPRTNQLTTNGIQQNIYQSSNCV